MSDTHQKIIYRGWRIRIFPPTQFLKEWAAFIDRSNADTFEPFCGLWQKTEEKAIAEAKKEVNLWLD